MKLFEITTKIRTWGLKGVVNYLFHRGNGKRIREFLLQNAKIPCHCTQGLTIIGNLSSQNSISKVLRDFAFSLKDAGLPFQTFDYGDHTIPTEDIAPILTTREEFCINRFDHVIEMLSSPLPDGIVKHRGRILFWEFEHGVLETYSILRDKPGDVIGMSDFNAEYYAKELADKRHVVKLLYPFRSAIHTAKDKLSARRQFGFGEDDFIVFYNFSLASGYYRKNPVGALKAFAQAFPNTPNAKMVFKVSHVDGHEDREREILDFAKSNGFSDRLVLIKDYLSQTDLFSLTNACDIYLSMHRSEGFGLGIAEAMSLGKAVVVTDYSSVKEFCHPENSILIPAQIVPIKPHQFEHPWYRVAKEWAEPDIGAAANALRSLYGNPHEIQRLGANAKEFIASYFSIENFRKSVQDYLRNAS